MARNPDLSTGDVFDRLQQAMELAMEEWPQALALFREVYRACLTRTAADRHNSTPAVTRASLAGEYVPMELPRPWGQCWFMKSWELQAPDRGRPHGPRSPEASATCS